MHTRGKGQDVFLLPFLRRGAIIASKKGMIAYPLLLVLEGDRSGR